MVSRLWVEPEQDFPGDGPKIVQRALDYAWVLRFQARTIYSNLNLKGVYFLHRLNPPAKTR